MESFAIYNEDKQKYLTGGTFNDIEYSGTDNPLAAHLYEVEDIAERQAKTILTQFTNHRPTKTLPVLSIHKLSNPTITVTSAGIIQPAKKKEGYSIEFRMTPKGDKPGGYQRDDPYTGYIRNVYGMVARVCDSNDYYYGKINHIITRGSKPTIWKTKKHVENLLNQLQPIMDAELARHWSYKAKVVKISV